MTFQHAGLAAGRWNELPFLEQMAHIGSEVTRACNWRAKNNPAYCERAAVRALDLIDLTLDTTRRLSRLRELARLREVVADYLFGDNAFASTGEGLKKYFEPFTYAARRGR